MLNVCAFLGVTCFLGFMFVGPKSRRRPKVEGEQNPTGSLQGV